VRLLRQRLDRGRVSPRTLLVAAYLVALHLAVMLSFARGPADCAPDRGLPGA
jgi:hypothetical protein